MPHRRLIVSMCLAVALAAITGCATRAQSGQALLTSKSITEPTVITGSRDLSANHRALALAAAHQNANQIAVGRNDQVSGWPSGITGVTAALRPGIEPDSNTGHPCESGEIIEVQLVGAFDTVTSGTTVGPGTSSSDTTVREIDLSVDATSGLTCLTGVRTEAAPPGPAATVLYRR